MLAKFSEWLRKNTKGWLIIILALLDGAFMFFILPLGQALMGGDNMQFQPLDLQFFYTPSDAYALIESYGAYGRSLYRMFELTVDILYPIVYTLFFCMLITWLLQRGFAPESSVQRLNVLPIGTWVFDLLENIGIVSMISVNPSMPAALAWITTIFTMMKWSFAGLSILLVLIGFIAALIRTSRNKAEAFLI